MNLRCTGLKISIIILFLPYLGYTQYLTFDTLSFYKHLDEHHLLREQVVFNKKIQQSYSKNVFVIDSLQLDLARIYFQLNLPDLSKNTLLKISENFHFSKKNNLRYLSLLVLHKEYEIAKEMIYTKKNMEVDVIYRNDLELSLSVLKREPPQYDTSHSQLSPVMYDLKTKYQQIPQHSSFRAGIYSALIPGLGKWYLGYKHQAITAFVVNMLLAAQAVESYYKAGVSSPRFIITTSVFSVFYIGNIWGSMLMAKKQKKDYLNQIDNEIFDYHNSYIINSIR